LEYKKNKIFQIFENMEELKKHHETVHQEFFQKLADDKE